MASYEEYVRKTQEDDLNQEIDDAAAASQDRQDNPDNRIPERFRGKTAEEIAESYLALERKFSQQGNDLGELRRTVDEWMRLQSEQPSNDNQPPQAQPVSIDDLYDNADETLRRVVKEESKSVSDRIARLEAELEQERANAQLSQLDSKYPGWRDQAQSAEFRDWVVGNPALQRLALMADQQGDIQAAEGLIDMWNERTSFAKQRDTARRDAQLRDASLESASPSPAERDGTQTFSRAELMNYRIKAKHGDLDAQTWLAKNQESIAIAYEGGHITD